MGRLVGKVIIIPKPVLEIFAHHFSQVLSPTFLSVNHDFLALSRNNVKRKFPRENVGCCLIHRLHLQAPTISQHFELRGTLEFLAVPCLWQILMDLLLKLLPES
jgi:hypothetical protein